MSDRHPLESTAADVARYTRRERDLRVGRLVERAHEIVQLAEADRPQRPVVARAVLFSGGNDSTTLLHLMRELGLVTHTVHANTGIGVEQTRDFVRRVSAEWDIPLIEKHPPPGRTYRDMVLSRKVDKHGRPVGGFPGPGQHWKSYQWLKESCLDAARVDLGVHRSRTRQALYIAGRRRDESERRVDVPLFEADGSVEWAAPFAEWTKPDLNTYRLRNDVPVNEVADLIHMSGECLCGAFAKPGELDEVAQWFPLDVAQIEELEDLLRDRDDIPVERRRWGWGAYRGRAHPEQLHRRGRLCSSCQDPTTRAAA